MELVKDISLGESNWKARGNHFFTGLCIQQDPAELNDLGRVLCDIYAMFITGCCYVDDQVPI